MGRNDWDDIECDVDGERDTGVLNDREMTDSSFFPPPHNGDNGGGLGYGDAGGAPAIPPPYAAYGAASRGHGIGHYSSADPVGRQHGNPGSSTEAGSRFEQHSSFDDQFGGALPPPDEHDGNLQSIQAHSLVPPRETTQASSVVDMDSAANEVAVREGTQASSVIDIDG